MAILRQLEDDGYRLRAKLMPPKGFLVSDALLSDAFAAVLDLEQKGPKGRENMWNYTH